MIKLLSILLFLFARLSFSFGQEFLTIIENENVGVNNSDPQHTLDVDGDLNASGDVISGNLVSPQLDYIYGGSQVLRDYWYANAAVGTYYPIASSYNSSVLGSPRIPNPNIEQYDLYFYISANISTGGVVLSINKIDLFLSSSQSTSVH